MGGLQLVFLTYLPLYLVGNRGLDPALAGVAVGVAVAAGGVGRLGFGMSFDRFTSTRVGPLVVSALGSGMGLVLLFVVPDVVVWPLVVLLGACSIGWNGVYHTVVTESARPGRVGRASAVGLFFIVAGSVALPPPLGIIASRGWGWTWTAAAAMTLTAAGVIGLSSVRSRSAEQRATD